MARLDLEVLYQAAVEVRGGRDGEVTAVGGIPPLMPERAPGPGGRGTSANPEQLLAIAFAASFGSALDFEARQAGRVIDPLRVVALVTLGHGDDGCYAIAIELRCHLVGLSPEAAERLVKAARRACPYCSMVRDTVDLVILTAGADDP